MSEMELIREVISENRYLTLSTSDGGEPWAAPLEYMADEDLNLFFLSTRDSRHARHIERNPTVSVAIFDTDQPEYSPAASTALRGVQIRATARKMGKDEYPDAVNAAIAALEPPMPPYEVFKITPERFYLPRLVDGVNERLEVSAGSD